VVGAFAIARGDPARASLPGADRLIAYHVVTSGRCFASLDGGEAVPLEAGEVVMFTNADPHVMSSSAGMRAERQPPT